MELWLVFVLSLGVAAGSSVEVQSSEDGSENWRKPYVSLVPQARLNFAALAEEDPNNWRKSRVLGFNDDPNSWRAQRYFRLPDLPIFSFFKKQEQQQEQGPAEDRKGFKTNKEGPGLKSIGHEGDEELEGVYGCAPGIPRCIPRLGR